MQCSLFVSIISPLFALICNFRGTIEHCLSSSVVAVTDDTFYCSSPAEVAHSLHLYRNIYFSNSAIAVASKPKDSSAHERITLEFIAKWMVGVVPRNAQADLPGPGKDYECRAKIGASAETLAGVYV